MLLRHHFADLRPQFVAFWLHSLIVIVYNLLRYGDSINVTNISTAQKHLGILYLGTLFLSIPILSVCNIVMLYHVGKSSKFRGGSAMPGRKAVKTVIFICSLFILSYVPTMLGLVLHELGVDFPAWFGLICNFFVMLNAVSNPIIYVFTNPNFRLFLRGFYQEAEITLFNSKSLSYGGIKNSPNLKRNRTM